ncbi:putative peptidoglycan-binding peptidase, M23/M37 family [Aurantimonas manganoxydans SI85-9A1]|uniref:Putative peptidoglycan-binding peptidase, M23/M37 family n=2 Tax=Aurantimonas manganoxydans TaxID=651183 RepID=Q1YIQ0_AURMS|nr:peptidoglycan DD-metalloendopeptidase family protein [Aurantimonas manganoxydans]EAS50067.1 putative peptidoglycan-binding peptidase, M23/M37 family [Aurantimonas manganoxydans SI85-9A1]BAT29288.1 putative peptidoglycan-binding peptidase, M23/M37 family [Aurantimonas manganoxydans SI85-9A1]
MRINVLKSVRLRMVRSVAMVGMAGLAAGCSSDVVRFDDGFYTGAVPQAPASNQMAAASQPYPGDVDAMNTGSVSRGMPAYGNGAQAASGYPAQNQGSYQTAANSYPQGGVATSGAVQTSQLPPPPPPSYANAPQSQVSAAPTSSSMPATRGAPPSTLGEQAARVVSPQSRPMQSSAATSQPTRSAAASGSVKVESGDSLLGIARRTGVSVADIKRANGMSDDTIRIGQTLSLPAGASAPTRVASAEPKAAPEPQRQAEPQKVEADSSPKSYSPPKTAEKSGRPSATETPTAASPSTTVSKEVETEVAAVAPNSTGISQLRWPVQGRVVNRFGEKVGSRRNDGLNLSVPRGTPIKAAENGVVIYAGDGLKEFGNTVLVKHDNGLVTVYGHADQIDVERGAKVKRGQQIAKSGMSGDTDVPLLHFEVRKDSAPVDPTKYLQ